MDVFKSNAMKQFCLIISLSLNIISSLGEDIKIANNYCSITYPMGVGLFTPNISHGEVLYFYETPVLGENTERLKPMDSIVFSATTYGGFDMSYFPEWLEPQYIKLDYDMFYFKVYSIGKQFVEIVVNTTENKTLYVAADSGSFIDWNVFILGVHSVEVSLDYPQKIKSQPLIGSKSILADGPFMLVPLHVNGDWLFVEIVDYEYRPKGKGWIQWRKDNYLIVRFKMLS